MPRIKTSKYFIFFISFVFLNIWIFSRLTDNSNDRKQLGDSIDLFLSSLHQSSIAYEIPLELDKYKLELENVISFYRYAIEEESEIELQIPDSFSFIRNDFSDANNSIVNIVNQVSQTKEFRPFMVFPKEGECIRLGYAECAILDMLQGNKSSFHEQYLLALAFYHRALHLIHKHNLPLPLLEANIWKKIAKLLENENHSYDEKKLFSLHEAYRVFGELNNTDQQVLIQWIKDQSIPGLFSKVDVLDLDSLKISHTDKVLLFADLGYVHWLQNEQSIARTFFNKAVNLYEDDSCNYKRIGFINYVGMSFMDEGLISKGDSVFTIATKSICKTEPNASKSKFVSLNIQSDYADVLPEYNLRDSLLALRQIGKNQLANDLEHFHDFLSINAMKILRSYPAESKQHGKEIIELTYNTKNQNFKIERQRHLDGKFDSKINELLKQINTFKDTTFLDNIHYENVLKQLVSAFKKDKPFLLQDKSLNIPQLNLKLRNENAVVVDFIQYEEDIACVLYSHENTQLHFSNTNDWNQIIESHGVKSNSKILQKLYDDILPFNKIVICADGILNDLSFESIFNKPVENIFSIKDYIDYEKHSISCSNSIYYSYSSDITLTSNAELEYTELPFAQDELQKIDQFTCGDFRYGANKSKLDFSDFKLLHFSTHALSSRTNKYDNYIVIRDENNEPLKIFGYDISNMSLDNNIVILSTCESGTGTYVTGQSTSSLASYFYSAGAQTVLKSLWTVDDKYTSEYMSKLYEYWVDGLSLGDANRLTRIYARDSLGLPNKMWDAFTLTGNPDIYLMQGDQNEEKLFNQYPQKK